MDCRRIEAPNAPRLRVMTYNLRAGLGAMGSWELGARSIEESLSPIAALIQAWQPDIVALQEVVVLDRQGQTLDQAGWLGQQSGMQLRFGPVVSLRQGGFWGNALLARFPIQAARTHRIDHHPHDDPRSLLEVVLSVNGTPVTCFAAHLSYRPVETARQVAQVAPAIHASLEAGPVVLAGDFNAAAHSEALAGLPLYGRDAFTLLGVSRNDAGRWSFPWGDDRCRDLDHIFLSHDFEPIGCQVVVDRTGASDHNPVVADCRLVADERIGVRGALEVGG